MPCDFYRNTFRMQRPTRECWTLSRLLGKFSLVESGFKAKMNAYSENMKQQQAHKSITAKSWSTSMHVSWWEPCQNLQFVRICSVGRTQFEKPNAFADIDKNIMDKIINLKSLLHTIQTNWLQMQSDLIRLLQYPLILIREQYIKLIQTQNKNHFERKKHDPLTFLSCVLCIYIRIRRNNVAIGPLFIISTENLLLLHMRS